MSPDLTMCDRDECPSRKLCYRYTAEPSSYQPYFAPPYPEIKDGKCEYFIKEEDGD
jgi:hypothetical protein